MTARRSGCRLGGWEGFFVNGADRWRGFNLKLGVICPLFLQGQIGQSGGNNLDSTRLNSTRLGLRAPGSVFSDTWTKQSGAWWLCFMFASCEQIDHFGGSFRGSQMRANPLKDIRVTLEGTISQRLHSVCHAALVILDSRCWKNSSVGEFLKRLLLFVCLKVPR